MEEKVNKDSSVLALKEKINRLRGVSSGTGSLMNSNKVIHTEEDKKKYSLDDLYKFIDDWCEKKQQE